MQQKSILQSPEDENRYQFQKLYIKDWNDGQYLTYQSKNIISPLQLSQLPHLEIYCLHVV